MLEGLFETSRPVLEFELRSILGTWVEGFGEDGVGSGDPLAGVGGGGGVLKGLCVLAAPVHSLERCAELCGLV